MPKQNEPSNDEGDAETISASLHDPGRFAAIFDRHYDLILVYLARRVGQGLAEELASETFLRAFAQREGYDLGHHDVRPWLYGIATNLLRKHARTEERRRRAYARALEPEQHAGGLDAIDARADAEALGPVVAAAFSRLAPIDRDALLLLALTDLDYEGIAIATGVPVGTVRSRLNRARRHLQADLAPGEAGASTSQTRKRSRR
jgi:RNA polymerase sigma factor (sigma-70 family)